VANGKALPLFHYEEDLQHIIEKLFEKHGRCNMLINKSRKIGITEFMLRWLAWLTFSRYAGFDIMIICQREKQAKEHLDRLQAMLKPVSETVTDMNSERVRFQNGTRIWIFPSNSQAFRGPDRVKAIFLDEAAHFDAIDDEPILSALTPNLAITNGDMYMVSTPAGPRGFFWRIYYDPQTDFYKHTMPWTVSNGLLIDEKFIESERRNNILFEQEYLNQFLASSSSLFTPKDLEGVFV
jgi:hypothetical protein